MTYPTQYRQKALQKLKGGQTIREVAEELKISTRTLQNWKNNQVPTNTRTRRPIKIDKQALLEDVQKYPDAYHYERARRFNCSDRAIGKALKRLRITQKKTLRHPKADKQKRENFIAELIHFKKQKHPIIYLDESGFKSHDDRPYGYSLKDEKCFGQYNWQLKNRTNAIEAIYNNKLYIVEEI